MTQVHSWQLVSLGNAIPWGYYDQILSSHPRAVNFQRGKLVVSVCAVNSVPGPFRVVLGANKVQKIRSLRVETEKLVIDEAVELNYDPKQQYQTPSFPISAQNIVGKRIAAAAEEFQAQCPEDCVAGLVMNGSKAQSDYHRVLAACFKQGSKLLQEKKWQEGVNCFKGRGFGLTPSGDDFLVGLITGLAWLERILDKDWSDLRSRLTKLARGGNPLQNCFLDQAADLALNQDWAEYLLALQRPGADHVPWQTRIMSTGSTSGADSLSGFFFAFDILF